MAMPGNTVRIAASVLAAGASRRMGTHSSCCRRRQAPRAPRRSAPPVLFRRVLFPELLVTAAEGCGRAVVGWHRAQALVVRAPLAALVDVDTPEEFASL